MTSGVKGGDIQPDIAAAVFEQVRETLPEGLNGQLLLDTSLYEIGLDSVARMDIVNRIEEAFGVRFDEDDLYDLETCRDLVECVKRASRGAPHVPDGAGG